MKRILACLDGSPRARHVLSDAVALARLTGAKIHLFRAVGIPPEIPSVIYSVSPNELPEIFLRNAEKALTEMSRAVPPDLLGGISARVGSPWDAICTFAHELDADLVVIGSHGYSGLDRVLGTTAAKVVNHADRAVMVVRDKPVPNSR